MDNHNGERFGDSNSGARSSLCDATGKEPGGRRTISGLRRAGCGNSDSFTKSGRIKPEVEGKRISTSKQHTGNGDRGLHRRVDSEIWGNKQSYDNRDPENTRHEVSNKNAEYKAVKRIEDIKRRKFKVMKFLKILSINTNSLRSTGKRNDLEARMDMIDSDITVVSETQWNSKMETSAIKISGHQLAARADRKPDNSGGGCCIYVKNNVLYSDKFEKSINWQSQICSIKIKDIYIVAVYRRPHYNKKADEQLVAYLRNEYNGKRVVYCGDFNLKGIDWTPDVICAGVDSTDVTNGTKVSQIIARDSIWQEFIIEMGYEQLVEGSTHNLGNLLDIVITNKGSDIVRHKPEVDFSGFAGYSDHAGIIFDVNIVVDNETAMKTVFDYKNCDYTKLTESIIEKGVDQSISDFHKPNGKWTNFRNSILEARFEVCPMKKIGYSQKSPWITDNLRTLLRKERRLRRNACRYHNSNDKRLQTRKKWSKIRDFVHDKVRKSRLEYETKIITSLQFNNQAIFDHFKKLNASNTSPPLKNADGDVVYDDKTKCDMFQDHFVAIFGEEKPKVGKLWKEDGKLMER